MPSVLSFVVTDPDRPALRHVWVLDRKRVVWKCPVSGCRERVPAGPDVSHRAMRAHSRSHWRRKATQDV